MDTVTNWLRWLCSRQKRREDSAKHREEYERLNKVNDIDKFELLLKLMEDNRQELKQVRQHSHDIKDHMHGVNGQLELLRQSYEAKSKDDEVKFNAVHSRIDKEQSLNAKKFESIETKLSDIAPKVTHMNKVFDWASRIVITALIGGLLWATVQYISVK